MSKIAFIYPGQGAQKAGMGADFYENSVIAGKMFDEAGEVLQLDMKKMINLTLQNIRRRRWSLPALP